MAKRKLTELHVDWISLCARPVNGKGVVLKSADGHQPIMFDIKKSNDELRVVYGIVYAPGEVDDADAEGDFADADVIRKAMWSFMREGLQKNIDVQHSFAREDAYVVENWLLRKGDGLFPDEPEGSWAVGIKINSEDIWQKYKKGELTGLSLAGFGSGNVVEDVPVSKGDETGLLQFLKDLVKGKPSMDLTDAQLETVAEKVAEKLQKAQKKPDENPSGQGNQGTGDAAQAATGSEAFAELSKALKDLPNQITDAVAKAMPKGSDSGTFPGSFGGDDTVC
jgi:hypothetical protein